MPSRGAWRIDATIDAQGVEISGSQNFVFGDMSLTGNVDEFTEYAGVGVIVISPGAGASQTILPAAAWRNATVKTIATATLRAAREQISSESDSLSTVWPYFTRMESTFGVALSKIATLSGCIWRYDDSGHVVIAKEIFTGVTHPFRVLTRDPRLGQLEIVSEQLFARPGMLIDGKKITSVEHRIDNGSVRSILFYEES